MGEGRGEGESLEIREGPIPYFVKPRQSRHFREVGKSAKPVEQTALGHFTAEKSRGIVPARTPQQTFELYSIPAFETRQPEVVTGAQIGSNKQIVEPGTVLLSKINPRINRAWVVGAFSGYPKIASTEWITFPPHEKVEPKYLVHFLSQEVFRQFLASKASGVGGSLMRVKPSVIRDYPFPLPALDQQRSIVAQLETQLTRLDASVTALKRVQANLKRYRASVLKAACEGRLVPTEAELARREGRAYESGAELIRRMLVERRCKSVSRRKYQEPQVVDSGKLPAVPEGWTWANIEQVSSWLPGSIQSGAFGSQLLHSEFVSEGILAIGIDNVQDGYLSRGSNHRITLGKYAQLSKFTARPGDVVVTVMATVGRICVLPNDLETAIVTKHCYRITPAHNGIDSQFLAMTLRADGSTRWYIFGNIRGQTRPGINGAILKSAPVPLPPLTEQERIVAEVEQRFSIIEELEVHTADNLKRAERLKCSVLQSAFYE